MTESGKTKNVGDVERVVSALAGGALVSWGLRRRSLGGLIVAAAGADLLYRGFSGHCAVYQWLGKNTAETGPLEIESTLTIDKPADELYRLWREPDTLSRVMGDFAEVEATGDERWHWSAHGPADKDVEWESEITEDRTGELLRWRSYDDAPLRNDGEIRFDAAPQAPGTEVRLVMRFDPPGGALGRAAIKMLGPAPAMLASHALRRFKSLAETGEIPALRHNPSGRANEAQAAEG